MIVLSTIASLNLFSQEISDSIKLKERNDAFINYENYRSSITDTTVEVLKKLNIFQTELIIIDNAIIHKYISTNSRKNEELQKKITLSENEKEIAVKKFDEGKKWVFYGLIGAGLFVILTILFIILFIITNNKKKRALSQIIKIDKIKEKQIKEIGFLKSEIETYSVSNKNSTNQEKENIENELKSQKDKYNELIKEKNQLENSLKEKEKSFNELNDKQNQFITLKSNEINSLKENYEVQIIQLTNEKDQLKNSNQLIGSNIQEKEVLVNRKNEEIDKLNNQLAEVIELYEKEKSLRQQLDDKSLNSNEGMAYQMSNLEKTNTQLNEEKANLQKEIYVIKQELELLKQPTNNNSEQSPTTDHIIEDNNILKSELDQCKKQLQNEYQLRIEIENEIKQLIEEIKETRKS